MDGVYRAVKADGVRLLLTGTGGRWHTYSVGPDAEVMTPVDARVIDLVAEMGLVEASRDTAAFLPAEFESLIATPLIAHQTQLGVMWAAFRTTHTFGDAERTFLAILAGQAAIAVANARSFEAARRRREWLAAILANTPDPVLVVDRELCLQLVNPAAQDTFGILADDSIGQPLSNVLNAPELIALFHDHDENGGLPRMVEYTAPNGRGYSPTISDVRTESGEMTGWVLLLRDVSHFKRLNDNMSEFLHTVSHDMRSPLTFMKGYVDMLGMVGDLNEKQIEFAEKIGVGVVQMSEMVEKILEAGKIDPVTGNYELMREPSDVIEMVQKIISGLTEPANKKGITLICELDPGLPVLNVDRAMLSSAFTNLVENAVKYTPEGGKVEVEAKIKDNELLFRVTDNGYGISAENQEKLFQRNVRIHRKEWKRVKGNGLGLFIVKNVAQRHGGDAWVASVEGEGSTFYISIPLKGQNLVGAEKSST
jgi:two-component system phosphate regulon sensor histidine kinase PhoR